MKKLENKVAVVYGNGTVGGVIAKSFAREGAKFFLTGRTLMTTTDFTTTLLVDQTPQEAFNAINNVRGWWSEEIESSTDKLNDEFMYHYEDVHRCKMKIVEFVPNEKVVWHVMENYFNFTKDKSEWKGTDIVFEIAKKGDKTEVRFTHIGLVPAYECYNNCSNAWGMLVNGNLRKLITTGKDQPNAFATKA